MTCISALTLSLSMSSYAKIYKWTDSKGVVHYSATPPKKLQKKAKHKVKNIEKKIRFAAGRSHTSKNKGKDQKALKNKRNEEQENTDSELSPPEKKLVDYCKAQKVNLKSLKSNFRNIWIDTKGKKTKLTQKQRQQKVDFLKDRIKKDCAEVKTD